MRASRSFILASTKQSLCRLISRRINKWAQGGLGKEYRKILLNAGQEVVLNTKVVKKGMPQKQAEKELTALTSQDSVGSTGASAKQSGNLTISKVIQHRIRYFSDGVIIGSKGFVDGFFKSSRKRFGPKRTSGARKPRGALSPLNQKLYSIRDLQNDSS